MSSFPITTLMPAPGEKRLTGVFAQADETVTVYMPASDVPDPTTTFPCSQVFFIADTVTGVFLYQKSSQLFVEGLTAQSLWVFTEMMGANLRGYVISAFIVC